MRTLPDLTAKTISVLVGLPLDPLQAEGFDFAGQEIYSGHVGQKAGTSHGVEPVDLLDNKLGIHVDSQRRNLPTDSKVDCVDQTFVFRFVVSRAGELEGAFPCLLYVPGIRSFIDLHDESARTRRTRIPSTICPCSGSSHGSGICQAQKWCHSGFSSVPRFSFDQAA